MSSAEWIKFEKSLKDDPRVRVMARQLGNAHVTPERFKELLALGGEGLYTAVILGSLAKLWFYADTHVRDDDTIQLTVDDINEIVGVKGFAQILPADWLQILDPETVKLPFFHEHNGSTARVRAQTQKRVARHRERVTLESFKGEPTCNAASVTESLPDKRRGEEIKNLSATALRAAPIQYVSRGEPGWLQDFRQIYPDRPGGNSNWRGAHAEGAARLAEGHTVEQFHGGARRYHEFCKATGKLKTEFVMQPKKFLGASKLFLLPWNIPVSGERQQRESRDAAQWAEARDRAKAIGFREPWPQESPGSYLTAVKLAETRPAPKAAAASGGPRAVITECLDGGTP